MATKEKKYQPTEREKRFAHTDEDVGHLIIERADGKPFDKEAIINGTTSPTTKVNK